MTRVGVDPSFHRRRHEGQIHVFAHDATEHPHQADEDLVQVDHLGLHHLLAAEQQQLAREAGGSRRGQLDLFHVCTQRVGGGQVLQDEIAIAEDHAQDVVEVVRDTARQSADRLHLLGVPQLLLRPQQGPLGVGAAGLRQLAVRHVCDECDAVGRCQHRGAEQDRRPSAVLAEHLHLPRRRDARCRQLGDGLHSHRHELRRRELRPVDLAAGQLLPGVADHLEVGVVRVEDAPTEVRDGDAEDPGFVQLPQAALALLQGRLGLAARRAVSRLAHFALDGDGQAAEPVFQLSLIHI